MGKQYQLQMMIFIKAENDSVTVTGGGTGSIIQVNAIGNGGLTDFIIDDAGTGYEIGG